MKFFDLRSLSVMLFGNILAFLYFLGHPKLSGTLQAVRHTISRPNSLQLASLHRWGNFLKYRGFKVGGSLYEIVFGSKSGSLKMSLDKNDMCGLVDHWPVGMLSHV